MMTCVTFQEERFCKRSEEGDCLEDMGSKRCVFSEYGEWENEHKKSNGFVICLAMLLRFSAGGWIKAYE